MTIDINAESDDRREQQIRITSDGASSTTISLQIMSLDKEKGFFSTSSEIILTKVEALILAQTISTYFG